MQLLLYLERFRWFPVPPHQVRGMRAEVIRLSPPFDTGRYSFVHNKRQVALVKQRARHLMVLLTRDLGRHWAHPALISENLNRQ
jgi:hypothetical protein